MAAAPSLPPIIRQIRISDQIADYLVRYIAEGGLTPGASLPSENTLSRHFGVGRPVVREAMNTLAGRGVIATASGKVPTVLSLSEVPFSNLVSHGLMTRQVTTSQVLAVRRGLEEQGVMMAALHRGDADVACLQDLTRQLSHAVGDVDAFSRADIAFHRALAQATANPLMSAIMAGIADVVLESSRTGLGEARDAAEWETIMRLHRDIADAVIAGNAPAARQHMAAHFDSALGRLERRSAQQEKQQP